MGNSVDEKPKGKRHQQTNRSSGKVRPGGPHAHPELTDPDKTPGSGMFPSNGEDDGTGAPPSG